MDLILIRFYVELISNLTITHIKGTKSENPKDYGGKHISGAEFLIQNVFSVLDVT